MERLEKLKDADREETNQDDAAAFGSHVAARLRTFSPRECAVATLQIEQVLVNVQFPRSDQYSTGPSQHTSDYYNF